MKSYNAILSSISPSASQLSDLNKISTKFCKTLNVGLTGAKAILGGSGAKKTWLSGSFDIDIFVQFDYKYASKSEVLSDLLQAHLVKRKLKFKRVHGSRDYFLVNFEGQDFEVVPILKISRSEQAINITDVSPLHAKWVNKKATSLKDDIRLLKAFCKAQRVYGAESHINGFSGYACEVLTIYYKSFDNAIKSIAKWKAKVVIDPEKYYKTNALRFFNQDKILGPIVLIDPVDKDRNVTAAVSEEKFNLLIKKAKEFSKKPSIAFFEKKSVTVNDLEKKSKNYESTILEVKLKSGKSDVSGSKALKALDHINNKLVRFGFEVKDYGLIENLCWFYTKTPNQIIKQGPMLTDKKNVSAFKKKHKNNFNKNGRVYAKEVVKFKSVKQAINSIIKDDYVKQRVLSIKVIK